MTTTKALAKLYKTITGSEARNSIGRILSDLADSWSSKVASASDVAVAKDIPELPTSAGTYVLKVTKSGSDITYSWVAETLPQ